jgi:phytoene synthase
MPTPHLPQLEAPGAAQVEQCRGITAANSRSFYAASHLLRGTSRDAAYILYAFCRGADDDVDNAPDVAQALQQHALTRQRLLAMYAGETPTTDLARAFCWVAQRFGIPLDEPLALLDGMAMDLGEVRIRHEDDLLLYCYRAAGVVGRMMSRIMGRSDPLALRHAVDLGVAMQLTNMARDVGEDATRNRIYLPASWLVEHGGKPTDALLPAPNHAVRKSTLRMLHLAEEYYRSGMAGIRLLPWAVRPAMMAAALIYREIGVGVWERGGDGVTQRVRVPGIRKGTLALEALLRTCWAALLTPPHTHQSALHEPLVRLGVTL